MGLRRYLQRISTPAELRSIVPQARWFSTLLDLSGNLFAITANGA